MLLIIISTIIIAGVVISSVMLTVYLPSKGKYNSHKPITILDDEDFADYRFPGSGDETDPYLIEGLEIISNLYAIRIEGTTKFFEIDNCKFVTDDVSVYINSVAAGTAIIRSNIFVNGSIFVVQSNTVLIENNELENGGLYAIRIEDSSSTVIKNNTICNNEFGIFLVDASYSTLEDNYIYSNEIIQEESGFLDYGNVGILSQGTFNKIRNNTIILQDLGLFQQGGSSSITYNIISNCSEGIFVRSMNVSNITSNCITNNTEIGLHIFRTGYTTVNNNHLESNNISLQISESYFNDIRNNTFLSNFIGLEIHPGFPGTISYIPTSNNTVRLNLFAINSYYGVKNSWVCNYSKIFLNSFYFNNLLGTSQAYDEGNFSEWSSSSSEGNFWSEWLSGDYYIDGPSNSTDQFPLEFPPV